MTRPKEYEREEVLDRAIQVFWGKGFEAASMTDLVKATGLNTFSMYREFGSKEGLFEAVMERYYQAWPLKMINQMRDKPGLGSIRDFFSMLADAVAHKDYSGCLFMNTLVEKNVVDVKPVKRVKEFCVELSDLFETAIRAGQQAGDVGKDKDPRALAQYLLCVVQGLSLYGRISSDRKMIESMVKTALTAVEG